MSRHAVVVHGDAAICTLSGDLDLEEGSLLRKRFWEVIHQDNVKKLVVDLHKVSKLDPSAISLLVSTQSVVARRNCALILTGLHHRCRELLEQTHLDDYFEIRDRGEFVELQTG